MIEKQYIIDNCAQAMKACLEIVITIPCGFSIEAEPLVPYAAFTIECSPEYLPYIETMIADFV